MASLTKESIRENLIRLSKDTAHANPAIHKLCIQAAEAVIKSDKVSTAVRDSDIPHPFILALSSMKKVPLYVLDCVRLFLSHSFIDRDRFIDICETIMGRRWGEDAKLKILQFIPYLVGSEGVRDEILARLFCFVVEMRGSTYSHVALSAEVISKQMILVVFDRYLYDVGGLGAAGEEADDSAAHAPACEGHRADVLRIFELVLGLFDGSKTAQRKENVQYFFDILDITVENALDIETACAAAASAQAGVDALSEYHARVLEISRRGLGGDLAQWYLRILLKYIRKKRFCKEISMIIAGYLGSREAQAGAAVEFLCMLGVEDYSCVGGVIDTIVQYVTQGREFADKRLLVCRNVCSYMYSREMQSKDTASVECPPENRLQCTYSTHFGNFSRLFLMFMDEPSAPKSLLVETSRMVIAWAAAKNNREVYSAYVKALVALDEEECIGCIAHTAPYMQDTWGGVVDDLSDKGWLRIADETRKFDDDSLWHLLLALQESGHKERTERVISIYKANLARLIADENTDLIETCFKTTLRSGKGEHMRVLVLEYYGSICQCDVGAVFGDLGGRMENLPLLYLGMFAKTHGDYEAILEVLLETLKIVGEHLKDSWPIILEVLESAVSAKNSTEHGGAAGSIALKILHVVQWIAEENIYFMDTKHILRTMALLGDAATEDVGTVLVALNLYQEIGDFLVNRDAELLRFYFERVLPFLEDKRLEVVETALCQVFNTLQCHHGERDMEAFAEKRILPAVFGCLERFGLFLSRCYFEEHCSKLQEEGCVSAVDVSGEKSGHTSSSVFDLGAVDYHLLQRSLDIFFLAVGHINSYVGRHRLLHFPRTYLRFVSTSLRAGVSVEGVPEEDLSRWRNEFAMLCIDVFNIFLGAGTGEALPAVSCQWTEGGAQPPVDGQGTLSVGREVAEITQLCRQLYVDVCLHVPLGYYSEPVYIRLFDLYHSSSLSSAQTEVFCGALGRVLLGEERVSALCHQMFTLCNHILAHSHYAVVIALYTTLLKSNVAASVLQHLTASYCDRLSSSGLYAEVISSVHGTGDWGSAVEAIGMVSRGLRSLGKLRAFVEVSKSILYSTGTRAREKTMMRYLGTYREVVRNFWQGIRDNIDNEKYYIENELGDFCAVREEMLAEVFQGSAGREREGTQAEELAASIRHMMLESTSSNNLPAQHMDGRTECVKCLHDAYLVVACLAVMKEQSFKEHLAMQSYRILYEDMALRIVYDILRQRMKRRLAEFSREVQVYGMLYPRIRKEEVYAILGMLISSSDKQLVHFVLAELVECLSCRDTAVIRDIQSCLKIVHS